MAATLLSRAASGAFALRGARLLPKETLLPFLLPLLLLLAGTPPAVVIPAAATPASIPSGLTVFRLF